MAPEPVSVLDVGAIFDAAPAFVGCSAVLLLFVSCVALLNTRKSRALWATWKSRAEPATPASPDGGSCKRTKRVSIQPDGSPLAADAPTCSFSAVQPSPLLPPTSPAAFCDVQPQWEGSPPQRLVRAAGGGGGGGGGAGGGGGGAGGGASEPGCADGGGFSRPVAAPASADGVRLSPPLVAQQAALDRAKQQQQQQRQRQRRQQQPHPQPPTPEPRRAAPNGGVSLARPQVTSPASAMAQVRASAASATAESVAAAGVAVATAAAARAAAPLSRPEPPATTPVGARAYGTTPVYAAATPVYHGGTGTASAAARRAEARRVEAETRQLLGPLLVADSDEAAAQGETLLGALTRGARDEAEEGRQAALSHSAKAASHGEAASLLLAEHQQLQARIASGEVAVSVDDVLDGSCSPAVCLGGAAGAGAGAGGGFETMSSPECREAQASLACRQGELQALEQQLQQLAQQKAALQKQREAQRGAEALEARGARWQPRQEATAQQERELQAQREMNRKLNDDLEAATRAAEASRAAARARDAGATAAHQQRMARDGRDERWGARAVPTAQQPGAAPLAEQAAAPVRADGRDDRWAGRAGCSQGTRLLSPRTCGELGDQLVDDLSA